MHETSNPYTIQYALIEDVPLHLTYYRSEKERKNQTFIYLHGGGLVYGTADDLPKEYLERILEAGYDFITLEYPLAPEVTLDKIIEQTMIGLDWFLENYQRVLRLESNKFVLFGRSAGAYLAAYTASVMEQKPSALVLLYGYHSLEEAAFVRPNPFYLKFPKINERLIKRLIKEKPVAHGPKETRYALYVYYRQKGNWIQSLLPYGKKAVDYSLSENALVHLPPAFLAASKNDPDVPYSVSQKMKDYIPQAHLETIDSDTHDFDRDPTQPIGKETYEKLLTWLDDLNESTT